MNVKFVSTEILCVVGLCENEQYFADVICSFQHKYTGILGQEGLTDLYSCG